MFKRATILLVILEMSKENQLIYTYLCKIIHNFIEGLYWLGLEITPLTGGDHWHLSPSLS